MGSRYPFSTKSISFWLRYRGGAVEDIHLIWCRIYTAISSIITHSRQPGIRWFTRWTHSTCKLNQINLREDIENSFIIPWTFTLCKNYDRTRWLPTTIIVHRKLSNTLHHDVGRTQCKSIYHNPTFTAVSPCT